MLVGLWGKLNLRMGHLNRILFFLWKICLVNKDSTGKKMNTKVYNITVWKKQTDGSWKYVWD
jgi:ketosteroid isomerase-like protein